jgi:addiction module RelE/StbE family toxin
MAFKIVWSELARQDLQDIVEFIARDNLPAAETFGYNLIAKVDPLQNFPRLGRAVPEKGNEDIREIIFRPYRIVYQVVEAQKVIAIVRLWHAARGDPDIPS